MEKQSKMLKHIILIITVIIFSSNYSIAQDTTQYNFVDYTQPKEYILSKVNIIGTKYVNKSNIIDISGLKNNQIIKVPGNSISSAINKLWQQNLFSQKLK